MFCLIIKLLNLAVLRSVWLSHDLLWNCLTLLSMCVCVINSQTCMGWVSQSDSWYRRPKAATGLSLQATPGNSQSRDVSRPPAGGLEVKKNTRLINKWNRKLITLYFLLSVWKLNLSDPTLNKTSVSFFGLPRNVIQGALILSLFIEHHHQIKILVRPILWIMTKYLQI